MEKTSRQTFLEKMTQACLNAGTESPLYKATLDDAVGSDDEDLIDDLWDDITDWWDCLKPDWDYKSSEAKAYYEKYFEGLFDRYWNVDFPHRRDEL